LADEVERMKYPGDGAYGHRDGYNVLYGDGSVRWHGDPQQRLIWMPMPMNLTNVSIPPGNNNYDNYRWYHVSFGTGFFHHFDDGEFHWLEEAN
jgi:prepilin-type processing-associated H-X9-DG protein